MKGKYSSKFKKAAFGLTAVTTSLLIGMTAACASNNSNGSTTNEEENKVTTKEDLQDIKNGNFEFYDDNDGLYPISTPDNWSFSYNGSNSSSMSGIIKTNKEGWDYLTDPNLPETLKANDDLSSSSADKKDYNGALSDDMLYKNMHNALGDDLADKDAEDKKAYIANPNTHNLRWDEEAEKYVYVDEKGQTVDVYTDEDGKVYSDAELKNEIGTSVLMIHNYRKSYFRGTEGYYESSTTLSLEANTTCKISLWVKTAELYCDNSKGERSEVTFNKGAYIKVDSTVGGNSLDSFVIKNINTEVLNTTDENNGWIQYTVYVQASTFATTTVSLTLGLGENGSKGINTVEGYAFFDDITFEKYRNIELLKDNTDFNSTIRENDVSGKIKNTCYPLSTDANMTFRVDEPKYQTEGGSQIQPNNSEDKSFFINFASTQANVITLNSGNVKSGLTVDGDKYTSSKNTNFSSSGVSLDNSSSTAKLPTNFKDTGLTVSSDMLALEDIDSNWTFAKTGFEYNTLLTNSLKSASKLPDVSGSAKTLIMLSAKGAAYETKIIDDTDTFKIDDGEYKLISFWLKTSDFDGKTAATITVYDPEDDENSSNYKLDSTSQGKVSFGDEEDIYDGWVRCFIRVQNNSGQNGKSFGIKINLGNTTIKGTSTTDYKYGWVAVTNFTVMTPNEDVYGYTSNLSNSTELSYAETTETFSKEFDTEQGGSNSQIKTDLATPSSYTGANGNSVSVKPNNLGSTDYNTTNNNDYAGLLNRENVENYRGKNWLSAICPNYSLLTNEEIWNTIAGRYSYQPLLIVNSLRNFNNVDAIYNYGYIGNTSTFSSAGYSKVSVRVKVSSGAVAYVYLIDTDSENNDVLTYKTPEICFFYDDNGNILKEAANSKDKEIEASAKIAYKLRDDGLYESVDGDGKLYANYYNLTKYYDYKYEHESFFDEEGHPVTFEKLVTGVTYYADANKTKLAPHYLIAGGKENNKVYEYAGEVNGKSTYYYMENGVANKNKVVYGVDKSIASYTYDPATATPYSFVIDCRSDNTYADKWVTVTFNVHTGNVAKNYRLELWAGERDKETTENVAANSYVLFDYSPENQSSLDESSYESKLAYYTDAICRDLIENRRDDVKLPDKQSIAELEKLVRSDYENIYNYSATFYNFSLYDSSAFIPFNAQTAEDGQTGYDYKYSDYEEALGFLKVIDTDNLSMTAFVDYSLTDKEYEIIGEQNADVTPPSDDEETTTATSQNTTNVWLLAASIAIVVAILVAIIAILVKQLISKYGKTRKSVGKNTYNFNKNKRYVRKYVKANGKAPEVKEDAEDLAGEQSADAPVEENAPTTAEAAEEETETSTAEEIFPEENGEGEDKKPE